MATQTRRSSACSGRILAMDDSSGNEGGQAGAGHRAAGGVAGPSTGAHGSVGSRSSDVASPRTGAVDIERTFRRVYGQAVATLVRIFGDITLAEDAVQDAFVVASNRWPGQGVPANPAGWIITTARRRAIDIVRRSVRGRELEERYGVTAPRKDEFGSIGENGPVPDDRLRLIFTCCHPALRTEHQVALTLRLLGGLGVDEVARSFLVTEEAMAKRLVRAKYKIKAARIPYRVPEADDLPHRLRSVLAVIYLIYNAGADAPSRTELRSEAIRLGRALAELMPAEAEVAGLLALMLLSESRIAARRVGGHVVLLADQDRTLWDREAIVEGQAIVRACIRRDEPGPYQLQAAIQAVHCDAETFEATDWPQVVTLYDQLMGIAPTAVVALNRAIAVGEVEGPAAALAAIGEIGEALDGYHLMHATRGTLLRQLGDADSARAAFERAAALAATDRDRRFLTDQIAALQADVVGE